MVARVVRVLRGLIAVCISCMKNPLQQWVDFFNGWCFIYGRNYYRYTRYVMTRLDKAICRIEVAIIGNTID